MVTLEPSEPLLLYIAVTAQAASMVLVAERSEPHQPQERKGSTAGSSGSQDPEPAEEVVGSQLMAPSTATEPLEPTLGSNDQEATGSQFPEVDADPRVQESPEPEPMEVDAPNPPGGSGASSARYTASMRSSMTQRQGTYRCISCFMQSLSHSGSCITTSKLTRSRW
jgi:hypothetical protein